MELWRGLTPEERAHWRARQDSLDTNWIVDDLEPHEIEFYESFIAAGNRFQLIPRDRETRRPTNDFIWLDNGYLVAELKVTTPRYGHIRDHIAKSVARAASHGIIKEHFLIDVGSRAVPSKLHHQLSRYNQRNPSLQVRSIWLWCSNSLVQVELEG
jgi:hypothetical protein